MKYSQWQEGSVLAGLSDGRLTITLNKPERKNAMDLDGWQAIHDVIRVAEIDPDVRLVVLTGAGDAFCAGADISGTSEGHPLTRINRVMKTAEVLFNFTKPLIARIDGAAVGAGWNMALCADFIVATPRSKFLQIFVKRGLSIDFGGSWLLPRIVGHHRAKQLAMLGDMLSAEEAADWGLVNWVRESDEIDAFIDDLALRLAGGAPIAQSLSKALINEAATTSFGEAVTAEARAQTVNYGTADAQVARAAFAEKRTPEFTGEWRLA